MTDTGITSMQCYQADAKTLMSCTSSEALSFNASQDGRMGIDATTPDNNDGTLGFSYATVTGGCVKDNITGLTWELKTSDNGLRDFGKTFTNLGTNAVGDTSAYISHANDIASCGHTDGRLPATWELQSLVNHGIPGRTAANPGNVTIDSGWFSNTKGAAHWTSSQLPGNTRSAFVVSFGNGGIISTQRSSTINHVRLVRGADLSVAGGRFNHSTHGSEVTDAMTGLVWQRCTVGQTWNGRTGTSQFHYFDLAMRFVKSQSGWHVPNVKELSSLIDRNQSPHAIDAVAFPGMELDTDWSSSPVTGGPENSWIVFIQ